MTTCVGAICIVLYCCGCKRDAQPKASIVEAKGLVFRYGDVSLEVPEGWNCSRALGDDGLELYYEDAPAMFVVSPTGGNEELDTKAEWLEQVRSEREDLGSTYKTISDPISTKLGATSAYFVEGKESSERGARRDGYIVGDSRCSRFIAMWDSKDAYKKLSALFERVHFDDSRSNSPSNAATCRYGALSVSLPEDWTCSEFAKAHRINVTYDKSKAPFGLLLGKPKPIQERLTDDQWLARIAKQAKGSEKATSIRKNGVITYYVESLFDTKQFKNMRRRKGYIVGNANYASFVEVWPDREGKLAESVLSQVWAGLRLD